MKTNRHCASSLAIGKAIYLVFILIICLFSNTTFSQPACRADTSFTDILFVIDNSGSIDEDEYDEFSDIIMGTINKVQQKCQSSQIGVMHYGGAFGVHTFVEYDFSTINQFTGVERQFCITRDQFGNCSEGGGDDLNAAMGDVLSMIQNGTLNRNPINKLAIVIFTDAFGFNLECGFINCSVIRPFTNIDLLKSQYGAQVTVVGASQQAEASLLAIYASPGGTFDRVRLFSQDCPNTFDGCEMPRKYIPIEFNSPVDITSDSIAVCVDCKIDIVSGVTADLGEDQVLCEEEDGTITLTAQLLNGTEPYTYEWNQGLPNQSTHQVSPLITTEYSVTITDSNGCFGSDEVLITVDNCIPDCGASPIINCPADTILCPGSEIDISVLGSAVALPGDPNCADPIVSMRDTIVSSSNCEQIVHRIWEAKYPGDNSTFAVSQCTQLIHLIDNESPIIAGLPEELVVDSGPDCFATVTWEEPTIEDNCSVAGLTVSHDNGDIFELGLTIVTYTALDQCGNMTIDSFQINIIQNCCLEGPIINCPPDVEGCPTGTTDPMMTGMATATASSDLCGEPVITFVDELTSFGNCEDQKIIKRTWTATDSDNPDLFSSCVQIISLLDTIPPRLLSCPSNVTIDPDNPIHEWMDPMVDENCSFRLEYSIPNGSMFSIGETRVHVTAIDMCGNMDTCSFVVTVPEEVMITCPDMPVLRCLDTLDVSLIPIPEVSTKCELCQDDEANCIETTTTIDSVYSMDDKMIYTITYTATDLCGTDSECTTQLVIDNSPFIDCPDDLIIQSPPYGFTYVEWEKPSFLTCCSICKVKQIPGFLYMGQLGDSYYYCSYARVNWLKAQREAEKNGGNLVVIGSESENEFIARRLIEREAYIGLSDLSNEGDFKWVNDDNSNFRKWKSNQPDNDGNEDFVEMDAQGYWYDVDGNTKREFVMEIQGCDHVTQIEGPKSGSKFRPGTTTIKYMAEDGCGNSDECTFNIIVLPPLMPEFEILETFSASENLITVNPNPASNQLFIDVLVDRIQSIQIFRMDGQVIDKKIKMQAGNYNLDISTFDEGLHFIKVITHDGLTEMHKVVVQR